MPADEANRAYYEALARLTRPTRAAAYPNTLAPMRSLLRALGEPQRRISAVVVGGSVGKGTTAACLSQYLRAAGARVGTFSGPHLHSWRERFAIAGGWISPGEFSEWAAKLRRAHTGSEIAPSSFELNTALALCWFAEIGVDWAILEAGIGGRWDAVNAAGHQLAILTTIEAEHANLLGGSLASIAAHKAGLIPAGGQAISAPQLPAVGEILRDEAERKNARLRFVVSREDEPRSLARELATAAFRLLRPKAAVPAISLISPPGRYEWAAQGGRRWLLDGGHTARSGQKLAEFLARDSHSAKRVLFLLAMLRDKDARAFVAPLDSAGHEFLLTTVHGNRALPAAELRERAAFQRATVRLIPETAAALRQAQAGEHELVVVCGSLRLAARAREQLGLLPAALLEEARKTRALLAGQWEA